MLTFHKEFFMELLHNPYLCRSQKYKESKSAQELWTFIAQYSSSKKFKGSKLVSSKQIVPKLIAIIVQKQKLSPIVSAPQVIFYVEC